MRYKVDYSFELVEKNTFVSSDGCNSIWFKNIGVLPGGDDATINIVADLKPDQEIKLDNPDPNAVIDQNFQVTFGGVAATKKVLVTRIYKRAIK